MQRRFSLHAAAFLALLGAGLAVSLLSAGTSGLKSAFASAASSSRAAAAASWNTADGKKPQFIVFAFDGSRSVGMWKDTQAFEDEMAASSTPIHFTYFINAVYFLNERDRALYQPPLHALGESAIGFGGSDQEIADRVAQVNSAYAQGNEIASHTVAHYNGIGWSAGDWTQEFNSFDSLLFHRTGTDPEGSPLPHFTFGPDEIAGFRAPELGTSPGLYDALAARNFRYDASLVGDEKKWPYKDAQGLWEFPLGSINLAGWTTLSMDYSIYMSQTGVQDSAFKGTPLWNSLYAELLSAYEHSFQDNYSGARAPLYVSHHFSLWNDGLYWEVMKSFAREECGKPDVHCVSYRDLADALDAMPAGTSLNSN